MVSRNLAQRIGMFIVTFGLLVSFVFVLLPLLNNSCSPLNRMSAYLDSNGIDPSRYYYTDVEQVKEAENYLRSVLTDRKTTPPGARRE